MEEFTWISSRSIDVSKNRALKYLYYAGSDEILDISNNTALETLQFHNRLGKVLSFANNTSLKNVLIHMKDGEKYDFSNNVLIENIYLQGWFKEDGNYYNIEYDIEKCLDISDLTILICDIEALDVRRYSKLKNILISGCENLSIINASGLQYLESFQGNESNTSYSLVEADFSYCTNLKKLVLWNIKNLNLTGCTSLEGWSNYPR